MIDYLRWHYSTAYRDLTRIWANYLWFVAHFFSLGILLKTLLAPYKRMKEKNTKGLDLEAIGEVIAVNTVMRLVGLVLRSVVLVIGFVVLGVVLALGIIAYVVWTLFPFVLVALLLVSIFGWDTLLLRL